MAARIDCPYAKKFKEYINSDGEFNLVKWFNDHRDKCPYCGAELDWQSRVHIDHNSLEEQEYASYCSCMGDSFWEHMYGPITKKVISAWISC